MGSVLNAGCHQFCERFINYNILSGGGRPSRGGCRLPQKQQRSEPMATLALRDSGQSLKCEYPIQSLAGGVGFFLKYGKRYINKVCGDVAMVKLIVYNIEYCEGMTGLWWEYLEFWKIFFPPKNLDLKIVDQIKKLKPDILALIEVDTGSFRSKKDEVVFFEKKLGMKNFVEQVKYPFQGWLKFFHFVPILNKQANAIIAKEKLSNVRYHMLHEGTKRVVIEATIHVPEKVTLLLAHLSLGKEARAEQICELIKIINNIKNAVILMGDFNTFNGEEA